MQLHPFLTSFQVKEEETSRVCARLIRPPRSPHGIVNPNPECDVRFLSQSPPASALDAQAMVSNRFTRSTSTSSAWLENISDSMVVPSGEK